MKPSRIFNALARKANLLTGNVFEGIQVGAFRDKGGSVHNVRAYGAVGNGLVDDTEAVLSAVEAAFPGGHVHFPPGHYTLTQEITLDFPVVVTGAGYRTVIEQTTPLTPLFEITSSDVELRGFAAQAVLGSSMASAGSVIRATGGWDAYLEGLAFEDLVLSDANYGIYLQYCLQPKLRNVDISNIWYATMAGLSVSGLRWKGGNLGNLVGTPNSYGISATRTAQAPNPTDLLTHPRSRDWIVEGVFVDGSPWEAFDVHAGIDIHFVNCHSVNCFHGAAIGSDADGHPSINCSFDGVLRRGTAPAGGTGVSISGSASARSTDCRAYVRLCEGYGADGETGGAVRVAYTTRTQIPNAYIKDAVGGGIVAYESNDGLDIAEPNVEGLTGSASVTAAYKFTGGTHTGRISNPRGKIGAQHGIKINSTSQIATLGSVEIETSGYLFLVGDTLGEARRGRATIAPCYQNTAEMTGTFQPNLNTHEEYLLIQGDGSLTFGQWVGRATPGQRICFQVEAYGGHAISFDSSYYILLDAIPNTAAGKINFVEFVFDGNRNKFVQRAWGKQS